jgi:hypothetical protein
VPLPHQRRVAAEVVVVVVVVLPHHLEVAAAAVGEEAVVQPQNYQSGVGAVVLVEGAFSQAEAGVRVHLVCPGEGGEAAAAHSVRLRQGANGGREAREVWKAAGLLVRVTMEGGHAKAAEELLGRVGRLEEMVVHAGVYYETVEAEAKREGAQLLTRTSNPVVHA